MVPRKRYRLLFPIIPVLLLIVLNTSSNEIEPFEKVTNLKSAFLDGKLPTRAPVPWKFTSLYRSINFDSPFMTRIIRVTGEDYFLALGVDGKVWMFNGRNENPEPRVVLDLSYKVANKGSGLVGIALHPNFGNTDKPHYRELFLYYSIGEDEPPIYNILAKYKFTPNLDSILLSSEEILIHQYDRSFEHDGGALFFDQEGYLYLTFGDEGFPHTRALENTQSIEHKLFGSIIRIDVDMDETRSHPIRRQPSQIEDRPDGLPPSFTQNYYIPNDNPWVDDAGRYMEEYFAIGFRSPHTAYYDTATRNIWVADVGDASWEELSIISAKSNGMWPYFEGPEEKITPPTEVIGDPVFPAHFYDRDEGVAIIGGFIYRGEKHPNLYGSYIFGDYETGNIWSYDTKQGNPVSLLTRGVGRIVAFFPCLDGGICAMRLGGQILKLEENQVVEAAPELLSDLGAFEDLQSLTPSNGITPYEINSPLWSDGSIKKRWISVPDTSKIIFEVGNPWTFPVGTVFIKHFDLPISEDSVKRLETRFFVIDLDKNGYGLTYRWDSTDTEARLVGFEEVVRDTLEVFSGSEQIEQVWDYPTRSQCLQCHKDNASFVLGVKTSQMNRYVSLHPGMDAVNQISLWQELGFFEDHEIPSDLPLLSNISDTTFNREHRVRSYLDANCSHCHQPYGAEVRFDARFSTPIRNQKIIDHDVFSEHSIHGNKIVKPGDLEMSEIWIRDSSLGSIKMPPLAKNKLDESYLSVLKDWIENMQELSVKEEFVIFPNPITERRFQIATDYEIIKIGLYDLTGREIPIEISNIDSPQKEVEITGEIEKGIYNLIYQTNNKMFFRKIAINY